MKSIFYRHELEPTSMLVFLLIAKKIRLQGLKMMYLAFKLKVAAMQKGGGANLQN